MQYENARPLMQSMRLPFLPLSFVSVFLGTAVALNGGVGIDWLDLVLVLLVALAAHVAVNTLNEHHDFRSGLDALTERTPFSGGSGALPASPQVLPLVYGVALGALATTVLLGAVLVLRHGAVLLPIGIVGLLIIVTYTRWLNRYPWPCLMAPGVAFGPLMVLGTNLVLAAGINGTAIAASLIQCLLASNLLLLNQLPDIDADRQVGRRHFAIAYGPNASVYAYAAMSALVGTILIGSVLADLFPLQTLWVLLPLSGSIIVARGVARHLRDSTALVPSLALNVALILGTPILLGVALIWF